MTLEAVGTALIRRHIGRRLSALRDTAKLTQEQAAKAVDLSRSTIVRMEDGVEGVRFKERDVAAMLDVYKAEDEDRQVLLALAAETRNGRKKGWWHDYTDTELPEWFGLFVILEDSATRIREYQAEIIPGLLQTEEYAELLFRTPPGLTTPDQAKDRLKVRMGRQSVLTRQTPPRFEVVLNEAIISRPIGDPGFITRQFERLLDMMKRPNVSIRILPWSAGVHGGMTAGNSFRLMNFPEDPSGEPIEPPLAYVDTLTGAMYLNKADEFAAYERVWRDIDRKALSVTQSKELITSALEGLQQ